MGQALRLLLKLSIWLAVAWAGLRWFERLNLFFPDRRLTRNPSDLGLPYEDVGLLASDGVKLHGWFIPAAPDSPVMLVCHGNAGNISSRLDRAAAFRREGLATLLFDYRGYGRSEGRPTEEGMQRDALAAYDWLIAEGIVPNRIVPFGESLGGSIALEVALKRPVGAVALEASPTSTVELGQELLPFLPVRWIARYRFDALGRIAKLNRPVAVAQSPQDEIVPFRHGEALFAAAREPKLFIRLSGGHNDAFEKAGGAYARKLADFARSASAR